MEDRSLNFFLNNQREYDLAVLEARRISLEKMKFPWLEGSKEIGFLTVPKSISIVVGDSNRNLLWVRVSYEWCSKIRLSFPILIYDYLRGEYLAGVVKSIGYDLENPSSYERGGLIPNVVFTSELIQYNDVEFLETLPVFGVEPICSIKKDFDTIVKGTVNFAPHIRAPAFIPPENMINEIFGLPKEGVPYGIILIGEDPIKDPNNNRFLAYRMRKDLLFEHELVLGSTGKGKTVKCKNDVYGFLTYVNGAIIIFDMHNEYSMIKENPEFLERNVVSSFDKKIWQDLKVNPIKVEDLITWMWVPNGFKEEEPTDPNVNYFSIKFNAINPEQLQYYLPALSPQGYVVLPRLVRKFKEYSFGHTFEDFYEWLQNSNFDPYLISNRTKEALLRRLAPILEEGIFDNPNFNDIDIKEILRNGRVSVFRLDHIKSNMARRIVVFHVISKIASVKLTDSKERYPPTMILIDEAHNFFPRNIYDDDERDYVTRAINWVDRICKEGRKFRLRMEFSTQSPEDLHPNVIKTVNTITFFGCTPIQVNTLDKIMDIPVSKNDLTNLPMRQAIIFSRGNSDIPIRILIPWPLLNHKITKK